MSDYGISISWGNSHPGREKMGLELWGDALNHAEKLKANGRVSDYDVVVFTPGGTGMPAGIFTLWGTKEQVQELLFDDERSDLVNRTILVNQNVSQVMAFRGQALIDGFGSYSEVVGSL